MHLQKRRKGMFGVGGHLPVPVAVLEEPDGVGMKSVAIIKDPELEYLLTYNTTIDHMEK
jgi:hypothetical protein